MRSKKCNNFQILNTKSKNAKNVKGYIKRISYTTKNTYVHEACIKN